MSNSRKNPFMKLPESKKSFISSTEHEGIIETIKLKSPPQITYHKISLKRKEKLLKTY